MPQKGHALLFFPDFQAFAAFLGDCQADSSWRPLPRSAREEAGRLGAGFGEFSGTHEASGHRGRRVRRSSITPRSYGIHLTRPPKILWAAIAPHSVSYFSNAIYTQPSRTVGELISRRGYP